MNPPSQRKQRIQSGASLALGVLCASCCLLCFLTSPAAGQETAKPQATTDKSADEAGATFFESKIRPLLVNRCYDCHGPDSDEGEAELRVDSLAGLLQGGKSGPALVRGEPDRSLIILAVRHDGAVPMPPKTKLPQAEIDALAAWVKMEAHGPARRMSRRQNVRRKRPHNGTKRLAASGLSSRCVPWRRPP